MDHQPLPRAWTGSGEGRMVLQGVSRVLFSGGGLGSGLAKETYIHPHIHVKMPEQTELKSRWGWGGRNETQWLRGLS